MNNEVTKYFPLSHAQKRIWYTEKIHPDTSAAALAFTVKYAGKIDKLLLEKAINILLYRYDGLRLRMVECDDSGFTEIKQYIADYKEISIDSYDFTNSDNDKNRSDWLEQKTREPFNLIDNDLFYFAYIRFNQDESGYYLKLHHSIFDGWSLFLLLEEINAIYAKLEKGIQTDTAQTPSYVNYIRDEQAYIDSEDFEKDKAFWLENLLPLPEKNELSFSSNNEGNITSNRKVLLIDSDLHEKLHTYSKQEKTTIYKIFMTALAIYISRATANNDVVVGMANHNRALPEHQKMIGMFVSTFPLRINVNPDGNFKELSEQIGRDIKYIVKNHGRYPFDLLAADLREKTGIDPGYLLNINLVGHPDFNDPDTNISYQSPGSEPGAMSIHINPSFQDDRGILEIVWEYQTASFTEDEIESMQNCVVNILHDVLLDPDKKISNIELVRTEEKEQILYDFNDTLINYPTEQTIHEIFEEQVKLYPDKAAVVFKDEVLTYDELNCKANQLARVLQDKGVGPEQFVGIMADPCMEMITGILAVLKAGGAYVPIDPGYPSERITYMLEDAGVSILLSQNHLLSGLVFSGDFIDLQDASMYKGENSNLSPCCGPSDLAYIIYTSGTTGKPKGVMIEHGSLVNMSLWNRDYHSFTAEDNCTKYAGFGFDASVFEIFPCLISGAALHIIPGEIRLSIDELNDYFENKHITYSFLPTQMAEQFMKYKKNKSLRFLWAAGEKLKFFSNQSYKLINGYGPTEYTVVTSAFEVDRLYDNIPIGKPVANTRIYILDDKNRLQPVGLPGELCVAGRGIARGYLNRPDLTAEKFIPDPFVADEKMYRTGDLARWLPDGNLEFLGRIDQQVKLRGFRIELGEIEAHLMNCPGIREAVVVVREDNRQQQYLCAYLVSNQEPDTNLIKDYLHNFLPDYMIPAFFMTIEKIPLTANGKVDKRMLPEPQILEAATSEDVLPQNEIQQKIAAAWKKVLGYENVGIYDNFFSMGGHSLKAIALAGELQHDFIITVKDIFNYQDIAGLAEKISPREDLGRTIYENLQPLPESEYYPVSSAQERLYFLYQMGNMGISYNIPMALLIEGNLDLAKLSQAIDKMVERHETLRTSFDVIDGKTVQRVHEKVKYKREFREGKEEDIPVIIQDFIRPFDLDRAPLFRIGLVKLEKTKYLFLCDIHHIIFDGSSGNIFLQELWELYRGKELPQLKLQYKDYAVWQKSIQDSKELKQQEKFWLDVFRGDIPNLNLCTDRPRPSAASFEGDLRFFSMGKELSAKLKQLVADTNSTMFTVLLSATACLFCRYASQEDIVLGIPSAGRTAPGLENMIGMFVNSLPVRCTPEREKSFIELLEGIKSFLPDAYDNQDYQLDRLIEKLDLKRDSSRNPLFDVMFSLRSQNAALKLDSLYLTPLDVDFKVAKFDLGLEIVENCDELGFVLEYRTDLFYEASIRKMGEHYLNLLTAICNQPYAKIKDLNLASKEEKELLLDSFNDTQVDYPPVETIQELFEEQVHLYPANMAVVFADQSLSYEELNQKANQLARLLRTNGVKPDDFVGIMVEPCLEMITGMLAVLKAGGAYLPIDPAYPPERIKYMLDDAGAGILLTQTKFINYVEFPGQIIDLQAAENYQGETANLDSINQASDLAYIIYTSGTTGQPKGVMIEHRSLVNLAFWSREMYDICSDDHCSKYAGFSFDAGVKEIFSCLAAGAQLHIIPPEIRLSLEELNDYFNKQQITIADLPTPMAEQFMTITNNSSLRYLVTGGDKLKTFNLRDYTFVNEYGPTEFTVVTTTYPVKEFTANIPIGKPVPNSRVYILDKEQQLQPLGVPGELCIAGAGLAKGYLNRPDLTAEKFIDDPFYPGEKMYRTGDLARWLPDGNIEFLGRIDKQVQIRGFRVELGEIEAQITEHPSVQETVVVALEDNTGNTYLCAYITGSSTVNAEEVKKYLADFIPGYMIPSYFIQVDNIPLTPNGKVDRRALPEPIIETAKRAVPQNIIQQKIATAWQKILGYEEIGIKDNFFNLGGNSLKAVALVTEMQKDFEVTINDIFKYQTIAELSENIDMIKDNLKLKLQALKQEMPLSIAKQEELLSDSQIKQALDEYRSENEKYTSLDLEKCRNYENIMLTGATGYLGIYLLRELLQKKTAHIYLPVRAKNDEEAHQRIVHKTLYYFGEDLLDNYGGRITVFKSELAEAQLGLEEEYYTRLARTVDCIIHSAANVKHYGHYDDFYEANVQSTKQLLKFAEDIKIKDFHQISTVSVAEGSIDNCSHVLFTEASCDNGQESGNYYLATKLEAEKMVIAARKNGRCCNIYRLGNITFDSNTGIPQENLDDNAFYQQLRAYVNLGVVPDQFNEAEFSFVDQVSKAIVLLFNRAELKNETYHMQNSHVVELGDVLADSSLGLNISKLSFNRFIDFLIKNMDKKGYLEFIENTMLHHGWLEERADNSTYTQCMVCSEKTEMILKKLNFQWPKLDPIRLNKIIYKTLSERIAYLKGHKLLTGLPDEEIFNLACSARMEYCEDDDYILWEDEHGESFYFILDGFVEISKTSLTGWSGTISVLHQDEFLGEDAVVSKEASAVTATALMGDAQVLRWPGDVIRNIMEINPFLSISFLKAMNKKVEKLEKLLVNMA